MRRGEIYGALALDKELQASKDCGEWEEQSSPGSGPEIIWNLIHASDFMWTEQAVFIELGKIYISAMKVMEAMDLRALWGGVGGVCMGKVKGRKRKG